MENAEIALRYLDALSSGADADRIAAFFAPDAVQEELPNRLVPNGAIRDVAALKEGRRRGLAFLASEHYEVLATLADGDRVALEVRWTATVAAKAGPFEPGQKLSARFAVFLDFRDGLIVRQRNYDCFDPW